MSLNISYFISPHVQALNCLTSLKDDNKKILRDHIHMIILLYITILTIVNLLMYLIYTLFYHRCVSFLTSTVELILTRVTWEGSISQGIAQVRWAYGQAYGGVSQLSIDLSRPASLWELRCPRKGWLECLRKLAKHELVLYVFCIQVSAWDPTLLPWLMNYNL